MTEQKQKRNTSAHDGQNLTNTMKIDNLLVMSAAAELGLTYPHYRPATSGIPPYLVRSQRQKRRDWRRTHPHGK